MNIKMAEIIWIKIKKSKKKNIFYQKGNYFNRKYFIYIREIKREKPKRLNKHHKHIRD